MNGLFSAKKKGYMKDSPVSKASTFIKIAMILIIVILLVLSADILMQYSEVLSESERVGSEIDMAEDRVGELEYLIEAPKNDKSLIIRLAREKLGLVLPEEIVYYSDNGN